MAKCLSMLLCATAALFQTAQLQASVIVDFEDAGLAPNSFEAGAPDYTSNGIVFSRQTDPVYGTDYDWAVSNQTDVTTPGYLNSYSAYTSTGGGGVGGTGNFGIAAIDAFNGGEARINLGQQSIVDGFFVTNTTYAYQAIANGDDGNNPPFLSGPFGPGDFFRLDVIGYDQNGAVAGTTNFYLADFRDGGSYIAQDWTWVDLTSLGSDVWALGFDLYSTDRSDFGNNTPSYFAMDNLTVTAVPEPSSLLALSTVAAAGLYRLRRKRATEAAQRIVV